MKGRTKPRELITLLDVLVDGFEKNEILDGFHDRRLPLPDEASAVRKFAQFAEEATRWQGTPSRTLEEGGRRLVAWPDLEIRQAGRGIWIRIRSAWFTDWWGERSTWEAEPLDAIYDWFEEERKR